MPVLGRLVGVRDAGPGAVMDADGTAVIEEEDGRLHRVSLALLTAEAVPLAPGDWLRTHSGLALQRIGEEEARAEIAAWREMSGRGKPVPAGGVEMRCHGGASHARS